MPSSRPLSLFDGPRTDFSLARLKHYTGTPPEDFQHFVLFTNYVRYVDEFVRFAIDTLRRPDSPFTSFSVPGGTFERGDLDDAEAQIAAGIWRRHQMPAYHLMTDKGDGVTLVNIGVGPSNAKTICDHIAVLRPEAWLMIGHCGGLRASQTIGDYVLAHAYLRDDHVLDDLLPPEIPIPAIAEVQNALFDATVRVTGEDEDSVKKRLRTGTVVTTDDRNWELRYTLSALRFNQSRAVAIDMESATVAAQGYRFRVPYGTLLCVSDKPLHGELKLPGQANAFYERAISQHLRIGIETLHLLKREGDACTAQTPQLRRTAAKIKRAAGPEPSSRDVLAARAMSRQGLDTNGRTGARTSPPPTPSASVPTRPPWEPLNSSPDKLRSHRGPSRRQPHRARRTRPGNCRRPSSGNC